MQEKIGWWTRDAGIKSNTYILTILDTNDVCVANKQTCNLKWWCINNDDFVLFNQGSKMPIKQMTPFFCYLRKWERWRTEKKKRNRFSVHFATRGYRSYEGHSLSFSPDILVPNILTPITLIFALLGDSSICIIFEKVEAEIYLFLSWSYLIPQKFFYQEIRFLQAFFLLIK